MQASVLLVVQRSFLIRLPLMVIECWMVASS